MIKIKICGIRRLAEAQVAARAGADFIGLVFVPGRRRRLELAQARAIVSGLRDSVAEPPQVVGLFAGQPLEEVNHTIETCGLDLAQLCGQESHESLDYCRGVKAQVIKVLHVSTGSAAVENLE
ncbi:MAG: phosphoribosylanthranilate isomerase, partial [Dehalococcoidia bacterium]